MSQPAPADSTPSAVRPRNVWQRRIADPIVAQLTQGLTPHKIALTVAVGSGIAMFPILGTTTLLCLLVGIVMKLNQPIIQAVNYACTPIHIPFIFYAFKWGDRLLGNSHQGLKFGHMIKMLREHPIDFVTRYSVTAMRAMLVWAVLVPFWIIAIYYIVLPIMRGIDRVRIEAAAKAAAEKAKTHPSP